MKQQLTKVECNYPWKAAMAAKSLQDLANRNKVVNHPSIWYQVNLDKIQDKNLDLKNQRE